MKTVYLKAILLSILSATAFAADPEQRTYPLDDNPACLDREGPNCVIMDNGDIRRRAIRIVPATPVTPTPAPAPAQPAGPGASTGEQGSSTAGTIMGGALPGRR